MPVHEYERVTDKDRVVSALCLGGCVYGACATFGGFCRSGEPWWKDVLCRLWARDVLQSSWRPTLV